MDRLIPQEAAEQAELQQLFAQQVYNKQKQVVHFPIRHHSPACSYHLLQVINDYQPQIILIEGPISGNALIPILADERTEAPVSLYYTYETNEEKAAFYFPLLDYSPEYAAIRQAAKLGIPAQFIDLNDRPLPREKVTERPAEESAEQVSYQDEKLLTGSSFISRLCRRLNCRSFDELWEKMFELGVAQQRTEDFMRSVFVYCSLSRFCYSRDELEQEGTLAREQHMRERILVAKAQYERILVITGGFHTYGLLEIPANNLPSDVPHIVKPAEYREQIYPMVYTFEEADRLNGYASGMPYVGYYAEIWKRLQQNSKASAYEQTAIHMLSRLMRVLRKQQEEISTSDAIEAYGMVQGLAILRGKPEGGVYELVDSVVSTFIKGEHTLASGQSLEELSRMLTGNRIGTVAPNTFTVPIVEDFRRLAAECKLQISTTGRHRKVLELYSKPLHRQTSRLLHCMVFLETEFGALESGPDWVAYRDVNLMRETWSYTYSSYTEARLIENSIHGGTIREAAAHRAEERIRQLPAHHSEEAASWLLRVLLMGLEDSADRLFEQVGRALRQDGSFLSLSRTVAILERIYEHRRLLGLHRESVLLELLQEAYHNTLAKITGLQHIHQDEQSQVIQALKQLYMLAESADGTFASEPLVDRLSELLSVSDLPPGLEGVCMAILSRIDGRDPAEITRRARAYMQGTPEQMLHTASYLQGVFAAARDVLLYDNALVDDLNTLLSRLPHEDFLRMIPELRLAFTFFTPAEIDRIADRVGSLFEKGSGSLAGSAVDETILQQSAALDRAIREELSRWRLI
ncbi:DUF5682 family protein [Paenibacillus bovis]|uniref:4-aminobutyrate aminotransferase n=1 Tax=Paenibacillus bovis TaxID=1616788 RepID=A0A172ZGF1_9BACL|nr:DUF5682 family protein [Paenibacillus bovis]ANF96678.1 hypothetical protein AR543_12095 [Paenibacillus bovis]